jgi:hypothetical protein
METIATNRVSRLPPENVRTNRIIAYTSQAMMATSPKVASPSERPPATAPKPVALLFEIELNIPKRMGAIKNRSGTHANTTAFVNFRFNTSSQDAGPMLL